jgi:hypothetical protein
MSANSFAGIDAGTSSPPFTLSGGRYVVTAMPGPTGPGQYHAGLCSLQMQQVQSAHSKPGVKFTAPDAYSAVGKSTDFQSPGSTTLHLSAGTYRFAASRSATSIASVTPAT